MRKKISRNDVEQSRKLFPENKEMPSLIIKRAHRASFTDQDNNIFTDYWLSGGRLIFGHAYPHSVLAAKKTAERGFSVPFLSREMIVLAQLLSEKFSGFEKLRFFPSEEEALINAVKLAQGQTGRKLVIKCDGSHALLNEHINDKYSLISIPYNDQEVFKKTFEQYRDKLAGVIIEPIRAKQGIVSAGDDFLITLRKRTRACGALLIFDEMASAYRSNPGGFPAPDGLIPDLICLGGIVNAGFGFGVMGGSREILETNKAGLDLFYPDRIALSAAFALLRSLDEPFYAKLNKKSSNLAEAINTSFSEFQVSGRVDVYGSMLKFQLQEDIWRGLVRYLFQKRIYLHPQADGLFFLSGVHSRKDLDYLLETLRDFLKRILPSKEKSQIKE